MKWIATLVVLYMFAAIMWWSTLLRNQNDLIYKLNTEPRNAIEQADLIKYRTKWEKQNKMILGEGLVIVASLFVGIYLIYRTYRKDIEISKSQNNFLLSFSHELKSPLTSINLSLDTLRKRELPRATQIEVCDIASNESKRLEALINSILMVAKIDDFTLHKEPVNIYKLIQDITNVLNATNEKRVKIEFEALPSEQNYSLDKQAIQSVIINLVENAIKYGGEDKSVTVSLEEKGDHLIIKVKDNGIGLSTENKVKIFQKFYRVGDESIRNSKGTGLGLYIVKRLVEAHQGNIIVSDNKPRGSIFTVTLPKKYIA